MSASTFGTGFTGMFEHVLALRPAPCECILCQEQFRTTTQQSFDLGLYQRNLSQIEAKTILAQYLQSINEDHRFLRGCLANHGDVILRRWRKRNHRERKAIILQVDPNIYPHQWSNVRLQYQHLTWRQAREYHKTWLLPYLSIEVLTTDPTTLFGLLHNRSQYSPVEWCAYDDSQITPGWQISAVKLDHFGGAVIMHGMKYGELTTWTRDAAHRHDMIGFPRAKLILEAQQHVMSFLRRIVELLLRGVDIDGAEGSAEWTKVMNAASQTRVSTGHSSPFLNQPFSAPPSFKFELLVSIAKTRLKDTGDHLWLLQTDPWYAQHYVKTQSQGAIIETAPSRKIAMSHLLAELTNDLWNHLGWQWVLEECQNVQDQHTRFQDAILPGQKLPREYDRALGALELLILNRMEKVSRHMMIFMTQRPGFRDKYTFVRSETGAVNIKRASGETMEEIFRNDPLDWCLTQLLYAPQAEVSFDYGMMFAMLEDHLSKARAPERARMDQALYDQLSNYAALAEIYQMIGLHRPICTKRSLVDVRRTEDHRRSWRYFGRAFPITDHDHDVFVESLTRLSSTPLPSGKKDLSYLESVKQSRLALSKFWAVYRECHHRCLAAASLEQSDIEMDMQLLSADTGAEHIKAIERERDEMLLTIANATKPKPGQKPGPVQTQWGTATTSDNQPTVVLKTKSKSQAQQQPPQPQAQTGQIAETSDNEAALKAAKVFAKQETIDTLSQMFTASTATGPRKKAIAWETFVSAMVDVGFSAKQGAGSAVDFEAGDDQKGKIVFHKPHPVAKIDRIMYQSMGKRMSKWFGWGPDTFCLQGEKHMEG